jgi:hypothetical protein
MANSYTCYTESADYGNHFLVAGTAILAISETVTCSYDFDDLRLSFDTEQHGSSDEFLLDLGLITTETCYGSGTASEFALGRIIYSAL